MMQNFATRPNPYLAALNPACIPIDGRDSRDRLAFVATYTRLIQYFDSKNKLAGNWQAFFLKDPAILFAEISKTDYEACHARFLSADEGLRHASSDAVRDVFVNQLCSLLRDIFRTLNQWLRFMGIRTELDHLRSFLEKKIRESLSAQLCLFISLQQRLSVQTNRGVEAPDTDLYRNFEPLWHERAYRLTELASAKDGDIRPIIAALQRVYHSVFDTLVQAVDYAKQAFYHKELEPNDFPDTALMITFCRLMATEVAEINKLGKKHLDFYYDRVLHQQLRTAVPDQVYVSLRLADKVESFQLSAGTAFLAGQYPDLSDILYCNATNEPLSKAVISSAYTVHCGRDDTAQAGEALFLKKISAPNQVSRNFMNEILSWDAFGGSSGVRIRQGFAIASPMLLLQSGHRKITVDLELAGGEPLEALADSQYFLSTAAGWMRVSPTDESSGNSLVFKLAVDDAPIVPFEENPDGYTSRWPLLKAVLSEKANLFAPPRLTKINIQAHVTGFTAFSLANDLGRLKESAPQPLFGPIPQAGARFFVGSNECFAKPLDALTLTITWDNLPLDADFCSYYSAYNTYLAKSDTKNSPPSATVFNNLAFKGTWAQLRQKKWTDLTPKVPVRVVPTPPQKASPSPAGVAPADSSPAIEEVKRSEPDVVARLWQLSKTVLQTALKLIGHDAARGASQPVESHAGNSESSKTFSKSVSSASSNRSEDTTGHVASTADDATVSLYQVYSSCVPPVSTDPLCPTSIFKFSFDTPAVSRDDAIWQPSLALAPLPPVNLASNGYLCFALSQPSYAFGATLYPQVVAQVSLDNAQWLIGQAKGCTAGSLVSMIGQLIKKVFAKFTGSSATAPASGPADLPNQPYIPSESIVTGCYTATASIAIGASLTDDTANPLELYHYGSFKPYLAYDSTNTANSTGYDNLVPADREAETAAVPPLQLYTGVGGQGCLYLSISGLQAPCTLSLYAEVSPDETRRLPEIGEVGYYMWGTEGWQPLTVLLDDTGCLSRSGIIRFAVPSVGPLHASNKFISSGSVPEKVAAAEGEQSFIASPLMPNDDFWIAIASKADGINLRLSYLDTQTVRLIRTTMAALPKGETPSLSPSVIRAPKNKVWQIASISQPFASFGGKPAEQKESFTPRESYYRRVSTRLNNKDRAISRADFADLALDADPGLFYAKVIPAELGKVRVALVQGYSNAQMPEAFRPNVDGARRQTVLQALAKRTSGQVGVEVVNFKHKVVTVYATIYIASDLDVGKMAVELNQSIKMYLSPWIESEGPKANIGPRINLSALIGFLVSRKGVRSVEKLSLDGSDELTSEDTIFVSAIEHQLVIKPTEAMLVTA
ncbi:MAG: hypothetical protein ING75_03835 [Rhodocyclaceae bacterium]|nr:hypothetical protein [Rhodocyclaceae bacterium]